MDIKKMKEKIKSVMNGLVEVTIPRPNNVGDATHAQFMINGKVYYVAYGVPQKVPLYVAEAWEHTKTMEDKHRRAVAAALKKPSASLAAINAGEFVR